MATIENSIIKELNQLKKELMIKLDKKEISEKDYKKAMTDISDMLTSELKKEINKEGDRIAALKPKEEVKMTKEVKVKKVEKVNVEKPVKVAKEKVPKVPKVKKVSRQDLILKALGLKTMNNVDKVVEKVLELRPEDRPKIKDVRVHVIWTVQKLKKPTGRFLKYTFNPETFELVEKQ